MSSTKLPLVPITATFALPLSLYYTFLQARVIGARITTKQSIAQSSAPSSSDKASDPLLVATRCQANFIENVPLALILAALVEANGGSRKVLVTALSALSVLRVLHVEMGMLVEEAKNGRPHTGIGRPVGFFGTVGVVLGLAGYGAWLGKATWGF